MGKALTEDGQIRDYFAEMYVAGVMADAKWNIYYPHRDQGFDFIATKVLSGKTIVRPVQVKGKYPTEGKTDKARYGYVGKLTAFHDDMVLAIPLFAGMQDKAPKHIAWMPRLSIRPMSQDRWRCEPARFISGTPEPRPGVALYFDEPGLSRLSVDPAIDILTSASGK